MSSHRKSRHVAQCKQVYYEWHGSLSAESERQLRQLCERSSGQVTLIDNDQTVSLRGVPGDACRSARRFVDANLEPCGECAPGKPCLWAELRLRQRGGGALQSPVEVFVSLLCDHLCGARLDVAVSSAPGEDSFMAERRAQEKMSRKALDHGWLVVLAPWPGLDPSFHACSACRLKAVFP